MKSDGVRVDESIDVLTTNVARGSRYFSSEEFHIDYVN
jgi:hypothetical protein